MPKPKLHQLHQSGATSGQAPLWDPDAMDGLGEWAAGDVVKGLTSADSSVTITDNGDGTLDLAAAGGGGGGGVFIGVKVHRSAAYTLVSGTNTPLPFDAEDFDTDAFHDNSTNNTRLTVPSGKAGKYLISGGFQSSSASGAGRTAIKFQKNGTDIPGSISVDSGSTFAGLSTTAVADLAVGDYIELLYYVTTASLSVGSAALSMYKIG